MTRVRGARFCERRPAAFNEPRAVADNLHPSDPSGQVSYHSHYKAFSPAAAAVLFARAPGPHSCERASGPRRLARSSLGSLRAFRRCAVCFQAPWAVPLETAKCHRQCHTTPNDLLLTFGLLLPHPSASPASAISSYDTQSLAKKL